MRLRTDWICKVADAVQDPIKNGGNLKHPAGRRGTRRSVRSTRQALRGIFGRHIVDERLMILTLKLDYW